MATISFPLWLFIVAVFVIVVVILALVLTMFRLSAQVMKLQEILANDMFVTFSAMKGDLDLNALPTLGPGTGKFWE